MPDGAIENDPRVLDPKELLSRYAAGERKFGDVVLHRADLSGQDLRNINLVKAVLTEANLSDANLQNSRFARAKFRGACLRGANLRRAGLHGTDLMNADLREAELGGTELDYADPIGTNLKDSNFYEASLESVFLWNTTMPNGSVIVKRTEWL